MAQPGTQTGAAVASDSFGEMNLGVIEVVAQCKAQCRQIVKVPIQVPYLAYQGEIGCQSLVAQFWQVIVRQEIFGQGIAQILICVDIHAGCAMPVLLPSRDMASPRQKSART